MKRHLIKSMATIAIIMTLITQTLVGDTYSRAAVSDQTAILGNSITSELIMDQLSSGKMAYQEEEISSPIEKNSSESIVGMTCNPSGNCEVFTITYTASYTISKCSRYTLTDDKWQVSDIKWTDAFGAKTSKYPNMFQYSSDGSLYCIALDSVDYTSPNSLVKISESGKVELIDTPALTTKINSRNPSITSYVITANNQFIFTNSFNGIYSYDLKTGKKLFENTNYSVGNITTKGDTVSFVNIFEGDLVTLNYKAGAEVDSTKLHYVPKDNSDLELFYTKVLTDGEGIFTINKEGIYLYPSDNVVCCFDGYGKQLGAPNCTVVEATTGTNHSFYVLSSDSEGNVYFNRYSLTNTSDISYKSTLNITLYNKDERVSQAINLFSKQHPDIKIDYSFLTKSDSADTQKQKCEQADILVFNNDQYSQIKAYDILKDISSTAKSLVKSEGLYDNIIAPFYEKSNLYLMPVDFTPYIYAGSKTLLASTSSLSSLQKYSSKQDTAIWQGLGYETLGNVTYQFFNHTLLTADGEWNKTGITNLLKNVKKTCKIDTTDSWIDESEWFDRTCYSNYIKYPDSLLASKINEVDDMMILQAALDKTGGKYQCTGSFEADSLVSVNKNADEALTTEFIELLFQDKAQSARIGGGLPMKADSLYTWSQITYSYRTLYNSKGEISLQGKLLTDATIKGFIGNLTKLSTPIIYNQDQAASMASAIEPYMIGYKNLDKTVKNIMTNDPVTTKYPSLNLSTKEDLNVLFIGNSLTRVGDIPGQFEKIAELNDKKVNINTILKDGYHLYEHLIYLKSSKDSLKLLKEADIVILNEYGGYTDTTVIDILTLMSMASKDTKFLILLTDYDTDYDTDKERRLSQIDNLTLIPSGHIHDQLIRNIYTYDDLHQPNDYHPNRLNGFISSEAVYVSLFGPDLSKVTYKNFSSSLIDYLKATSQTGKETEFNKLKDYVLEQYQ